jgi:hypothetical protein
MKGEAEQGGVTPSAAISQLCSQREQYPGCDPLQPDLHASAKAALPGSTEPVPREVQPGEQDRFRGVHQQQEARSVSRRAA